MNLHDFVYVLSIKYWISNYNTLIRMNCEQSFSGRIIYENNSSKNIRVHNGLLGQCTNSEPKYRH